MAHKATITIDHTKIPGDLTDYVVAVIPNSDAGWADLYALATEGGGDLRVYKDDDTTELPREIVSFSVSAETGEIFIKYTGTTSSTVDTDIHLYVDGSSSDYAVGATYGRNAVWSNYRGVWHLGDTTDGLTDSTGNGNNFTNSGATNSSEEPFGDGSVNFDGSNDRLNIPDNTFNSPTEFSYTLWVRNTNSSKNAPPLTWQGDYNTQLYHGNTGGRYLHDLYSTSSQQTEVTGLSTSTWYKFVCDYDGTDQRLIVDGVVEDTVSADDPSANTANSYVAKHRSLETYWQGQVKEIRLKNTANSANWETAEYNNQNSPTTFYSVAVAAGGEAETLAATAEVSADIATATTFTLALAASVTGAAATSMTKSLTRTLTASATGAATIATANLLFKTLTAAVGATASVATESVNAVRLITTLAATATVEKTLSLSRTLSAAIEGSATIAATKTFYQTLTAAIDAAATASGVKTFYETLTASIAASTAVTRGSLFKAVTLNAILKVTGKLNEYWYKKKYTKEDEDYKRKY